MRLSKEKKDEILNCYNENIPLNEILDKYKISRATYLEIADGRNNLIDLAIKFGTAKKAQEGSMQNSLFGGGADGNDIPEPQFKKLEEYPIFERLAREKELVGMYLSGHPLDQYKFELRKLNYTPVNDVAVKPQGQEIILIGMIQNARQGISKKGNPFGSFVLIDYDGSHEFVLFGEHYLKWSHMFQNNNMVLIKGKNEPRFRDSKDIEFKINHIELLSNLAEKMVNGIHLEIPVEFVDAVFIQTLKNIIEKFPGNKDLKMSVVDLQANISIQLISKKNKVALSPELYEELEKICHFDLLFRLN